jgi:HEPN domain-containing protein
MGDDTTGTSKIHDYYKLSCNYLESARISLKNELYEPAMFSAIHALELALKAALLTKIADGWKTHNIGGQFGKYFRKEVGDDICRRITVILSKYNLPRYPSEAAVDPDDVEKDIEFIGDFIEQHIVLLLRK